MAGPTFEPESRVVCCWSCGEPAAGADGATVPCGRCAQPVPFRPRPQYLAAPRQVNAPGPQPPALRAQDGKPLLPPASIQFLYEGMSIPEHRLSEALVAWQGARRRAASMDVAAGEELAMLTRELATAAERKRDYARARALIDSALEAAPVARQRSVLLGMMVRMAIRAREPAAAAKWLAHLEPGADLESDSELRMSVAVVAASQRNYANVIAALGSRFDEIAIQDALDAQAALFRVDALEKLGRAEEAKSELTRMLSAGPAMRIGLEKIREFYAPLNLAEQTFGGAIATHEAGARRGAGMGKIILGVVLVLAPMLPLAILSVVAVVMVLSGNLEALGGIGLGFVITLVTTIPFALWGVNTIRTGLRERHVFANGVRAQARVLSASPTGTSVNDIPELKIDLEVMLTPPVRSSVRRLVRPTELSMVIPGTILFVRVDPKNPQLAVLDQ